MSCDYHTLPHPGIQSLKPYVPGKSLEELRNETGITDIIKLASNENQLGCSPLAKQAIVNMSHHELATYPSPVNHKLMGVLSEKLGIEPNMLTLCNGSDTVYTLLLTLFALRNGKHMLTHEYAFSTYGIQAKTLGIPVIETPVKPDLQVDVDAIIQAVNADTAIIFLANPNNPTGLMLDLSEIERLLSKIPNNTLLVLDEAYYEYAFSLNDRTSLLLLNKYKNLVITRTFSKIYGLAGVRLGYAIANSCISALLARIQLPFVVNRVALEAAMAALSDVDFVKQTLIMNKQGIQQVYSGLKTLNLSIIPSHTNFLTFNCSVDGVQLYLELLKQGIIVRPLTPYKMPKHLRVTIGTKEQNSRFLNALTTSLNTINKEQTT